LFSAQIIHQGAKPAPAGCYQDENALPADPAVVASFARHEIECFGAVNPYYKKYFCSLYVQIGL
jgi:hypothetical protein